MAILSKQSLLTLCFLTVLTLNNNSFGQIDTVSVNLQFTTAIDPENSDSTLNVLHVMTEVTDIDFLGSVVTTVYDVNSNFPIYRIKGKKNELEANGEINGNIVTQEIFGLDPGRSYRIETTVKTYQGANYPVISTIYNAQ